MNKSNKPTKQLSERSKVSKRLPASPPGGHSSERREQQRSVETRMAILDAALMEFSEKGYEAASTRSIAKRASLHNTLLTYHFDNKDTLWRSTAEHFFGDISDKLAKTTVNDPNLQPIDKIREEFRSFFNFIVEHPRFHQFMIFEDQSNSPRLPWLIDTFLAPITKRVIPLIEAAQESGDLPKGSPVLVYYFLVSVTAALSAQTAEIKFHAEIEPITSPITEKYWNLVDRFVFSKGYQAKLS